MEAPSDTLLVGFPPPGKCFHDWVCKMRQRLLSSLPPEQQTRLRARISEQVSLLHLLQLYYRLSETYKGRLQHVPCAMVPLLCLPGIRARDIEEKVGQVLEQVRIALHLPPWEKDLLVVLVETWRRIRRYKPWQGWLDVVKGYIAVVLSMAGMPAPHPRNYKSCPPGASDGTSLHEGDSDQEGSARQSFKENCNLLLAAVRTLKERGDPPYAGSRRDHRDDVGGAVTPHLLATTSPAFVLLLLMRQAVDKVAKQRGYEELTDTSAPEGITFKALADLFRLQMGPDAICSLGNCKVRVLDGNFFVRVLSCEQLGGFGQDLRLLLAPFAQAETCGDDAHATLSCPCAPAPASTPIRKAGNK